MTHDAENLPGMIGRHPLMLEVYWRTRRVAAKNTPVLIVGETGTGKELVARALHELSPRTNGPFVPVNCAAIPETLAEAEFFGAERGAYTGSERRRIGYLSAANGGTLFLDEISSVALGVQAKLLRALETGEFYRVGEPKPLKSAFRLVAAVPEPVSLLVDHRRLREDIAYRLAHLTIQLPALRHRGSDILLIAEHVLAACGNGHGGKQLDEPARRLALRHSWPGNVRELCAVMTTIDALEDGSVITAQALAAELSGTASLQNADQLDAMLASHRWNLAAAARALRISRSTLYQWIERHELHRPTHR